MMGNVCMDCRYSVIFTSNELYCNLYGNMKTEDYFAIEGIEQKSTPLCGREAKGGIRAGFLQRAARRVHYSRGSGD